MHFKLLGITKITRMGLKVAINSLLLGSAALTPNPLILPQLTRLLTSATKGVPTLHSLH